MWPLALVWTLNFYFSLCWIIIEFPMTKITQNSISFTPLCLKIIKSPSWNPTHQEFSNNNITSMPPMSLKVLGWILLKSLKNLFNNSYIISLKHTKPPIHWKLSNGTRSVVGDLGDLNVHAWQANKPTNNLP